MRWTQIVALGAAATLGLTACGGGSKTNSSNDSSSNAKVEQAAATLDKDAKAPKAEPAGAKKGGTLTIEYGSAPESMDPSQQFYQDTAVMMRLTNRALTTFMVRDGKSVLVPDLATDLGTKSADGLTWTFTLRDGLKYSDGSPVKAADVVYAIQRSFAHEELPGGPTYQDEFFAGGDTYKGPWKSKDADFKAAEAKDDKTVVIHLAKKMESLPYFVSFSQFSPIPKAKDTKDPVQYQNQMLATGPYMIKKFTQGTDLTMVKNPHWDAKTDPARNQLVDGYRFVFNVDDQKSQTAILASNGTYATTLNWNPIDGSLVSKVTGEKKNQFISGPGSCTTAINMDTRKIPLEVRKAIMVAFPLRQAYAAGGDNQLSGSFTGTLLMPQIPGHQNYTIEGLKPGGTGDTAKAKEMLKAAGKEGFELKYYFAEDQPAAAKVNQVRKQALQEAGFKVTDMGVGMKDLRKLRKSTTADFNMLMSPSGWCFDWPSGDAVFPPTVTSNSMKSGSNWGDLSDAKVDAEVKRISELPLAQQNTEWGKFDKWLMENYLPAIPWYNDKGNVVFGTKVHGVVNDPNKGMPVLDGVWLDQ